MGLSYSCKPGGRNNWCSEENPVKEVSNKVWFGLCLVAARTVSPELAGKGSQSIQAAGAEKQISHNAVSNGRETPRCLSAPVGTTQAQVVGSCSVHSNIPLYDC